MMIKAEFNTTAFKQKDNVDQKMEDAKEKEENLDITDMDLTYQKPLHSLDLTNVLKEIYRSSKENDIVPTDGKQMIDAPQIGFVFRDQRWKLGDYELIMQIQQTKYPKI